MTDLRESTLEVCYEGMAEIISLRNYGKVSLEGQILREEGEGWWGGGGGR